MEKFQTDIVTLKPKWSVRDMFVERDQTVNRDRILYRLDHEYLSKGWELTEDIIWGKDYGYAVMKLARMPHN